MSVSGSHILVYPFPTSGHIIPFLNLTHRLLSHGLIITIAITPNNLPLLDPILSTLPASSKFHHLVLPSPPNSSFLATLRALRDHHYPVLLNWFQSHSYPPLAIISDFFLGWTNQLACRLGIPRLVFSPSGAFAVSVYSSLWREQPRNENPSDNSFVVSFPEVPRSPSYPWWQISHIYRQSREADPDREFFRESNMENLKSWGVVFNSFADLEQVYLNHMKAQFGEDRVWAVGPILPPDDRSSEPTSHDRSSPGMPLPSPEVVELLAWLDQLKDNSVVYICFGSREILTSQQMDELASALDRSGVHFVWCVRQPKERGESTEYGVLSDEFEDRVRGRGFIIKDWAPQVTILNHRAVGTFLTHCGWNSVLEGIAAGVVMLTWPMDADQFINAQLVVDDLGIGTRVGEQTVKIPKSEELARVLVETVEENRPERVKARKLREAALGAVEGGSSDRDLDGLVKRLNSLKNATPIVLPVSN